MPNPADILSLQDDEDPEDELRMQLAQGQGNNLAGAPMPPGQTGMQPGAPPPGQGIPGMMAPSPNVPGPLAALPKMVPRGKPHIRLKSKSAAKKPKPKIRLKAQANGGSI
jgi:hypothetical protein